MILRVINKTVSKKRKQYRDSHKVQIWKSRSEFLFHLSRQFTALDPVSSIPLVMGR